MTSNRIHKGESHYMELATGQLAYAPSPVVRRAVRQLEQKFLNHSFLGPNGELSESTQKFLDEHFDTFRKR